VETSLSTIYAAGVHELYIVAQLKCLLLCDRGYFLPSPLWWLYVTRPAFSIHHMSDFVVKVLGLDII
jgi:hypothetical protein